MNKIKINNINRMEYAPFAETKLPLAVRRWYPHRRWGSLRILVSLLSKCVFPQRSLVSYYFSLFKYSFYKHRMTHLPLPGTNKTFIKLTSTLLSLAHEN